MKPNSNIVRKEYFFTMIFYKILKYLQWIRIGLDWFSLDSNKMTITYPFNFCSFRIGGGPFLSLKH